MINLVEKQLAVCNKAVDVKDIGIWWNNFRSLSCKKAIWWMNMNKTKKKRGAWMCSGKIKPYEHCTDSVKLPIRLKNKNIWNKLNTGDTFCLKNV